MSLYVDIEKTLGSFHIKVKLEAGDETVALLGASGCGKSMTLKCIAGIETPDRGKILLDGVTLFDSEKKINLPPQQRRTGLMFQSYALFPHMTVSENIRAGARREPDRVKREKQISEIMAQFGLTEFARRLPHQLSGGQQQRVALARMLVSDPKILLLDEPFSALDTHLRFRLEQDVRQVISRFGKTVLLVSHDRDEVFRMTDKIAIMGHGHIEAIGEKHAVFENPKTRNGALLTGCKNISAIEKIDRHTLRATDWGITLTVPELGPDICAVGIRMRRIRQGPGPNSFRCRVEEVIENPFSHTVMLRPIGTDAPAALGWLLDKPQWDAIQNTEVEVHLPPDQILLLRKEVTL